MPSGAREIWYLTTKEPSWRGWSGTYLLSNCATTSAIRTPHAPLRRLGRLHAPRISVQSTASAITFPALALHLPLCDHLISATYIHCGIGNPPLSLFPPRVSGRLPGLFADMSSPRSLFAARQHNSNTNHTETRRANGRFWSRRSMNDSSPDGAVFSFKSIFSPLSSPPNMSQLNEPSKEPPQPVTNQNGLAPSQEYADKIFRRFHHHNLSDATTGSNDSSPTTTISTVDDSSATEPSPGSSPESPPPTTFAVGMLRPRTSDDNRPFFELQKQPPPKKGRNLKNLAVNTSRPQARAAASTTSLPLPANDTLNIQSLASPSFVKPPTPAKRKPSTLGLTLLTPGSSKAPPQEIRLAIPPTPAFGRPGTLRHFQSSPSLPLFPELSSHNSSLPPISRITTTLETILSPVQPEQPDEEEEQDFDVPLSKEEKPEAYPNGPITVYDPHIDLYLEPTAEQCRDYDVILNVASEVRNPLAEQVGLDPEEPDIRIDGGGGIQYALRRERLPSKDEKAIAHESSPTTPKATPLNETFAISNDSPSKKEPEYIHIKWEHNSDIVPDLLRLVKLIDEKAMLGKRVLVHCQCGVSRSASLVVAYGLYKNPALSVQEAYDAVKKRSKWIGPNMNLIMQLQEFRSSLMRGGLLSATRGLSPLTPGSALSEWRGPFAMSPTEREGPLSAGTSKHQASESLPAFSPGPSSAPSGMPWPPKEASQRGRSISAVKPGTAYVSPQGRIVPVVPMLNITEAEPAAPRPPRKLPPTLNLKREEPKVTASIQAVQSPRQAEFHLTPLQPSPDFDAADSFGLMSPTSSEFTTNPFDRSALLAQLGMGPVGRQEDPPRRSISLRSKPKPQQPEDANAASSSTTAPKRLPRLRGKISSPSIREQQQLQSLQAQISASLPHRTAQMSSLEPIDDALMSPRATKFTQNPFALALDVPPAQQQKQQQAAPSDPPQSPVYDPRSPAHKGVSPITRNILDVL